MILNKKGDIPVSKAIDVLMNEHRLIEKVMNALEVFTRSATSGQPVDREPLRQFVEFFRNFADKCHHGKEEDLLFASLMDHGLPREQGPLAVMFFEHGEGRAQVKALEEIGMGCGPLSAEETERLVQNAHAYVSLLRNHILKEDRILYPMAQQAIPVEEMEKLADQFNEFEDKAMGKGAHEEYHRLADALTAAYPTHR
jgi:hemerythrin-like domain-containing protein